MRSFAKALNVSVASVSNWANDNGKPSIGYLFNLRMSEDGWPWDFAHEALDILVPGWNNGHGQKQVSKVAK